MDYVRDLTRAVFMLLLIAVAAIVLVSHLRRSDIDELLSRSTSRLFAAAHTVSF